MLDKAKPKSAVNDDIGEETRLRLFETQVVIREAEQRAYDPVSYTHLTLPTNREV